MLRQALLWASRNAWLEGQMRRRSFARRAVSRFMPGETAEAALEATRKLREHEISTVFTKLGEALEDRDEIEKVMQHYTGLLERIAAERLNTQISIKLTQLGQDLGQDFAQANLKRLAESAAANGNVVWVDMEASPYVDETLDIFTTTLAEHPNLGLCVQAYLYRTTADVERLLALGARLRLVKGAYQEPAEIAYPRKADVDENFLALTRLMLENADPSAPQGIATHDIVLLARILEEARASGVPSGAFEVQMLYGIRTREQLALRRRGIPVRVLISYGPHWYAWYMRRLAERPANLGFVVRSVFTR
jgi:proline dehydrogenase